jgi:hypothetical protein
MFGLARVLESGPDELADVVVRQRIEDVLAVAAVLHDPLAAKQLELLREGRELGADCLGKLRHALLSAPELLDQAQPGLVARCPKESSRSRERLVGDDSLRARAGVRVGPQMGSLRFLISTTDEVLVPTAARVKLQSFERRSRAFVNSVNRCIERRARCRVGLEPARQAQETAGPRRFCEGRNRDGLRARRRSRGTNAAWMGARW